MKTRILTPLPAFFTFLRANLVLTPSAMSSNVSTPLLEPASAQALQPPSPSRLAQPSASATALDDIPPLSLDILTTREDKVDALRLVADSIAQQRQQASLHLVFHPLNLAGLAVALALVAQLFRHRDGGTLTTLVAGVVMAYLAAIRWATAGYLRAAEALSWSWLAADHVGAADDTVIATRWGRDLIGALVLRLEPAPPGSGSGSSGGRRRHRSGGSSGSNGSNNHLRGGRGVIRAWTTKLQYRGRGVGQDMLHEAVRVTRERCGRDAEVGFAQLHANSETVLPELYNAPFRKGEMRAAKALEHVLADWEGAKRKR